MLGHLRRAPLEGGYPSCGPGRDPQRLPARAAPTSDREYVRGHGGGDLLAVAGGPDVRGGIPCRESGHGVQRPYLFKLGSWREVRTPARSGRLRDGPVAGVLLSRGRRNRQRARARRGEWAGVVSRDGPYPLAPYSPDVKGAGTPYVVPKGMSAALGSIRSLPRSTEDAALMGNSLRRVFHARSDI